MKILFVCRGNVGRSQMAEALLAQMIGPEHEIVSAGTKLSGPEQPIGELGPIMNEMIQVMNEEGVEISSKVRKQVTEKMAQDADRIVLVVDDRDPIPEYLLNNAKVERWDILDPKGQDLDSHRKTRDQIRGKLLSLADEINIQK